MSPEEARELRNLKQRIWVRNRILAGAPMRVDAEPYIELLRKWNAVGFSSESLAAYTGTSGSVIRRLLRAERHHLTREFAVRLDHITAVAVINAAGDSMRVSPVGTVRRIRAAAWLSHPTSEFMPFPRLHTYLTGETRSIEAGEHRAVALKYRQLSQRIGSSKEARVHARVKNWLGPAYWDSSNIDDPFAGPLKLNRVRAQ